MSRLWWLLQEWPASLVTSEQSKPIFTNSPFQDNSALLPDYEPPTVVISYKRCEVYYIRNLPCAVRAHQGAGSACGVLSPACALQTQAHWSQSVLQGSLSGDRLPNSQFCDRAGERRGREQQNSPRVKTKSLGTARRWTVSNVSKGRSYCLSHEMKMPPEGKRLAR